MDEAVLKYASITRDTQPRQVVIRIWQLHKNVVWTWLCCLDNIRVPNNKLNSLLLFLSHSLSINLFLYVFLSNNGFTYYRGWRSIRYERWQTLLSVNELFNFIFKQNIQGGPLLLISAFHSGKNQHNILTTNQPVNELQNYQA